MNMQIGKWGNSLAVRFPKELVEKFDLKEGDVITAARMEVMLAGMNEEAVEQRRKAALEEIKKGRYKLPPDWKFDREEANWRPAMDRW